MTTIKATCETCGDVSFKHTQLHARVCVDNNYGEYRFKCPVCEMIMVKPAEPRTIDLLVSCGVELETWNLPEDLFDHKEWEKLTGADILEFEGTVNNDEQFYEELSLLQNKDN